MRTAINFSINVNSEILVIFEEIRCYETALFLVLTLEAGRPGKDIFSRKHIVQITVFNSQHHWTKNRKHCYKFI